MSISVTCANGHRLAAKEALAGQTLKCPTCQADVVSPVPLEPAGGEGQENQSNVAGKGDPPDETTYPLADSPSDVRNDPVPGSHPPAGSEPPPPTPPSANFKRPRQPALAPQARKDTVSAASSLALWGAAGGGLFVGLLIVAFVGLLLFGRGGRKEATVADASLESAPRVAREDGVTVEPSAPAAEPTKPVPGPLARPSGLEFMPLAAATKPFDLVGDDDVDQRIEGFVLPAPTWAAAYDEISGRLAVTNDDDGIVVYDVDD